MQSKRGIQSTSELKARRYAQPVRPACPPACLSVSQASSRNGVEGKGGGGRTDEGAVSCLEATGGWTPPPTGGRGVVKKGPAFDVRDPGPLLALLPGSAPLGHRRCACVGAVRMGLGGGHPPVCGTGTPGPPDPPRVRPIPKGPCGHGHGRCLNPPALPPITSLPITCLTPSV